MLRTLLIGFALVLFVPLAFGQVEVFVTSETLDGNLGGYAGADALCTNAAAAASARAVARTGSGSRQA